MKTILVVDDSPSVLGMLSTVLTVHGFRILQAKDGNEALDAFEGNKIDLVLADLLMPGMDGIELTREIRQRPKGALVPIVILTTQSNEAVQQAGIDAGVTSWILKPIPPVQLTALIRMAVAGVKMAR